MFDDDDDIGFAFYFSRSVASLVYLTISLLSKILEKTFHVKVVCWVGHSKLGKNSNMDELHQIAGREVELLGVGQLGQV